MKVIKIEDIDKNLSVSHGRLEQGQNVLNVELWGNNNDTPSQILVQITDLTIDTVDDHSKIYFIVKDKRVLDGVHILEDISLKIFTKVLSRLNIKGNFTFSSIVSSPATDGTNTDKIITLNTKYSDYPTTFIGVNGTNKGKIQLSDLIVTQKEKDSGISQMCSIVVELMGIKLDTKTAHISLDMRLRILKAKKIYKRMKIDDPNIFLDDRVSGSEQVSQTDEKNIMNNFSNLVNQTIIDDVEALVNTIDEGSCKDKDSDINEEYVDILNDSETSNSKCGSENIQENGSDQEKSFEDLDSLNSDSLNSDSLNSDSLNSDSSNSLDIVDNLTKIVKASKVKSNDIEDLDGLDSSQEKKQKVNRNQKVDKRKESIVNDSIITEDVVEEDDDEEDIEEDIEEDLESDASDVIDDDTSDEDLGESEDLSE